MSGRKQRRADCDIAARGLLPVPGNERYAVDRSGVVVNVRTGHALKQHVVCSEARPGAKRYERVALYRSDGGYDLRYVHCLVRQVFGSAAGIRVLEEIQ